LEFYYYESIQIWGASVKDAEGIKNVYDVLQGRL
jgi:hypothetical protein